MAQNSMYTKNDFSQSMIFSINTKQTLFWWFVDLLNHLRTEVMTKPVKKGYDLTTYIKLGL